MEVADISSVSQDSIVALDKSVADATAQRKEENADFQELVGDRFSINAILLLA